MEPNLASSTRAVSTVPDVLNALDAGARTALDSTAHVRGGCRRRERLVRDPRQGSRWGLGTRSRHSRPTTPAHRRTTSRSSGPLLASRGRKGMTIPNFAFFRGRVVPYAQARVAVLTHSLHYGTAVLGGVDK
jgi:hypothetical protein